MDNFEREGNSILINIFLSVVYTLESLHVPAGIRV
jgi:hypothetical protein